MTTAHELCLALRAAASTTAAMAAAEEVAGLLRLRESPVGRQGRHGESEWMSGVTWTLLVLVAGCRCACYRKAAGAR